MIDPTNNDNDPMRDLRKLAAEALARMSEENPTLAAGIAVSATLEKARAIFEAEQESAKLWASMGGGPGVKARLNSKNYPDDLVALLVEFGDLHCKFTLACGKLALRMQEALDEVADACDCPDCEMARAAEAEKDNEFMSAASTAEMLNTTLSKKPN